MSVKTKEARRLQRRRRVRAKVTGTASRPRLAVFRSNNGVFAQLIDDEAGRTLAAAQWTEADVRGLDRTEQATKVGELIARRAKAAGVETRRVRPWRLPVPRPRQGRGRRRPRSRTGNLGP